MVECFLCKHEDPNPVLSTHIERQAWGQLGVVEAGCGGSRVWNSVDTYLVFMNQISALYKTGYGVAQLSQNL